MNYSKNIAFINVLNFFCRKIYIQPNTHSKKNLILSGNSSEFFSYFKKTDLV